MAIAVWVIEESRNPAMTVRQIDAFGAVLSALGLGGISFTMSQGSASGWNQPLVVLLATVGVGASIASVLHEKRTEAPMLPCSH
jgi:hypothetical protein